MTGYHHHANDLPEERPAGLTLHPTLSQPFLGADTKPEQQNFEIKAMRDSFYTKFCNHWVALFGVGCIFRAILY